MINLFIWDDNFLIKEKIFSWKKIFKQKYWELNIIHIKNTWDFQISQISWDLITPWFMGEKKLIIIDDIPSNSKNKNNILEEEIIKFLDKIPENNIVIFNSINPDKRTKFFKILKEKSDKIEEFYINSPEKIINFLEKKYAKKISKTWILEIIKYKNNNLSKIILELEKLFITNDFIDEKIIKENIVPELDESIFVFIENILAWKLDLVLKNFKIILNFSNIYQFYNWLLANLRNTIFIQKLKKLKIPKSEIVEKLKLWNKAFLVSKNYNLSYEKLEKLYIDLINLEEKMKTWNMVWTNQEDFIFEIEKIFIKNLKKQ